VMTMRSNRPLRLTECESYQKSTPEEFYLTGIKELFDKCKTCIVVKGDHV